MLLLGTNQCMVQWSEIETARYLTRVMKICLPYHCPCYTFNSGDVHSLPQVALAIVLLGEAE